MVKTQTSQLTQERKSNESIVDIQNDVDGYLKFYANARKKAIKAPLPSLKIKYAVLALYVFLARIWNKDFE